MSYVTEFEGTSNKEDDRVSGESRDGALLQEEKRWTHVSCNHILLHPRLQRQTEHAVLAVNEQTMKSKDSGRGCEADRPPSLCSSRQVFQIDLWELFMSRSVINPPGSHDSESAAQTLTFKSSSSREEKVVNDLMETTPDLQI